MGMMEMTDGSLYEELVRVGFQSGETIHKLYPHMEVAELKEAQYGNTYDEPKPLRFEFGEKVVLVVVQTVTAVFVSDDAPGERPFGYYRLPNWNVEGWLLKSGFDADTKITRVRLYLQGFLGGALDEGFIQAIPENPVPGGPLLLMES